MSRIFIGILCAVLAFSLDTGAWAASPKQTVSLANGRLVAERQCSQCHAIGRSGKSPNPLAPPFRTILSRYRKDVLDRELAEGIKIGHAEMPELQINPAAVADLVTYLSSIQVKGKATPAGTKQGK